MRCSRIINDSRVDRDTVDQSHASEKKSERRGSERSKCHETETRKLSANVMRTIAGQHALMTVRSQASLADIHISNEHQAFLPVHRSSFE